MIIRMDETLSFYSDNAEDFVSRTIELDLSALYSEFLPHIPEGGSILDAGCGSGRDSLFFLNHGYRVHSFDAVPELTEKASKRIGQKVEVARFESFDSAQVFDGIWACASLLHVSSDLLPGAVINLSRHLKSGGVFYMSFKYGSGETLRGLRRFTDMDEDGLISLAQPLPELTLLKSWITADERPKRKGEAWMNIIWVK